ncbi:polysaccharide biosynthesis C-terminal domain-containing protein [Bacillus sp. FJAT-29814]|uniref:oligosaccharide flippase family protein n=1 Tax=Bacillus sp. FJAT-29814 TaxID=1729688 RepID=UPI00082C3817|nr:polysaccharide biosynthesis C-terminal domain-containing protein [Bacillus sp. FJAT-29814]
MNKLLKDSLIITVSKFARAVYLLLLTMLIARMYDLPTNALFREYNLLISLGVVILPWGVNLVFLYLYNLEKENETKNKIFWNSTIVFILYCSIILFIYLLISFIYKDLNSMFYKVTILSAILQAFFALLENKFVVVKKVRKYAIFSLIAYVILSLVGTFFTLLETELLNILYGILIVDIVRLIVLMITIYKDISFKLDITIIKNLFKRSFALGLNAVIQNVNIYLDSIFVLVFFSRSQFAIYSAGVMPIPIISILVVTLSTLVLGKMTEIYSETKIIKSSFDIWNNVFKISVVVVIPIFWFLLFYSMEYIQLVFGHKFLSAKFIFVIYLTKLLLSVTTFSNVLIILNKQNHILMNTVFATVSNVVFLWMFSKIFGLYGAVLSAVLMHSLIVYLQLWYTQKFSGISIAKMLEWTFIVKISVITLPIIIITKILSSIFLSNHIVNFFLSGLVFVGIYVFVIFKKKIVSIKDIKSLREKG